MTGYAEVSNPRLVTSATFNSSPSMDLTAYRQKIVERPENRLVELPELKQQGAELFAEVDSRYMLAQIAR